MKAKSIKGNSPDEIQQQLVKAITEEFKPNLAIVFFSVAHDLKRTSEIYDENEIAVFGAKTCRHFLENGNETEGSKLLFLNTNHDYFKNIG